MARRAARDPPIIVEGRLMSADPVSLALTAFSTIVSGVMSIAGGNQQSAALQYQAQQARNDATLQRESAAAEVEDLKRQQRRAAGAIRANAAASNLLVDDGLSLEAQLASASEAELEQLRRRWQGDVGAQRNESEALMLEARARETRTAGLFRAGAQLVTGGSRLYGLLGGSDAAASAAGRGDGRKPGFG